MADLESRVVKATDTKPKSRARRALPADDAMRRGLTIESIFCPAEVADPFETVEWDLRTASIKGEGGEVVFEQKDCEIPATWSQLATNVVVSKYFYGELGAAERETSVRQLIHRVCRTIADWGITDGYFASAEDGERFYRELTWLCLHQHASFNSPVWFNVGLYHLYGVSGAMCTWHWNRETGQIEQPENPYEFPQASACFIQSVEDNMEDIMELARSEAMLFKFGSGTGTDLSTLRSHREKLSGGGRPSGPLSFMRVYDQIAAVVKSGGKTRRAAKMQSIKDWHPDVMEFVECKQKEEEKARLLISKGYNADDAYSSVLFQNANLSVRLSDDFMKAVESDGPWTTHWVTDKTKEGPTYPAREMLDRIAKAAWACGDPGVQFDTTINRWHTCPNSGRINASNPCSEYMFLDDSACNLASVNLMKFRQPDGQFDVDRFLAACRVVFIAQEILVDHASYPTKRIALNSHRYRPIGLGYSNLGSLLMASGLPYDSEPARGVCGAITALLHGAACRTSTELAAVKGPFEEFEKNREPMLQVMEMHWEKVEEIQACPDHLRTAARKVWDEVLAGGRRYGFRNAQATVLAPTGTISFMMDCDTTGIEPDIALVKYKQLAGGGMLKIVNQTVPTALKRLGYEESEIESIVAYIEQEDTIEGAADLKTEHLPVFDCAFASPNGTRSIPWKAHVLMMAAAQPFISGAISKTVNMPKESTVEDIANAYLEGWRLGLKALAVYRDGSKGAQPLSTKSEASAKAEKPVFTPRRERLPDTRQSITHKFSVAGHEGYITVGLYPDGRPGELFITMAKEGSTIGGLMDCFGTSVSMSLQYGVPLDVYVNKFSHTRFEPMGHTKNPDIPIAKSIVDYLFRWLGITFLPGYREQNRSIPTAVPGDGSKDHAPGDVDAERWPASTKVGGPNTGQGPASAGSKVAAKPSPAANGHANGSAKRNGSPNGASATATLPARERTLSMQLDSTASEQFASFQEDAPICDSCGAITVRNGSCYLCYNCGQSMGCS
jgi:ribonucleoside-diphosphate reductase alpha chain